MRSSSTVTIQAASSQHGRKNYSYLVDCNTSLIKKNTLFAKLYLKCIHYADNCDYYIRSMHHMTVGAL